MLAISLIAIRGMVTKPTGASVGDMRPNRTGESDGQMRTN